MLKSFPSKILLIISVFLFTSFLSIQFYNAESSDNDYSEKTENTEIRSAELVTINEEFTGERIITGSNVKINGKTNGNLIVAGEKVEINGDVDGSVFVAGGGVVINGSISENLYVAGNKVYVNSINISGDVFYGAFEGGIVTSAVKGKVFGSNSKNDVASYLGTVTNTNDVEIDNFKMTEEFSKSMQQVGQKLGWIALIVGFLSTLILVLVIVYAFPVKNSMLVETLNTRKLSDTFMKALIGLIFVIGATILIMFSMFIVVGFSFAIFLIIIMLLLWIYSFCISYYLIGNEILALFGGQIKNKFVATTIGVILVSVLYFIPIINILVGLVHWLLMLAVTGQIVTMKYEAFRMRSNVKIEN